MGNLEITIEINGETQTFPATCVNLGYAYEFHVLIDQTTFCFETNKEGQYQALLADGTSKKTVNNAILRAIANSLKKMITP